MLQGEKQQISFRDDGVAVYCDSRPPSSGDTSWCLQHGLGAEQPAAAEQGVHCDRCGKWVKTKSGLGGHRRSCKAVDHSEPAAAKLPDGMVYLDSTQLTTSLVGATVSVFWPLDDEWYQGQPQGTQSPFVEDDVHCVFVLWIVGR